MEEISQHPPLHGGPQPAPAGDLTQDRSLESLHQDQRSLKDQGHVGECRPDPPEDQQEVRGPEPAQTEAHRGPGGRPEARLDQDLMQDEQIQDAASQHQDRAEHRSDSNPTTANQDAARESGGSLPALVVTAAEEPRRPTPADPTSPVEPWTAVRPSELEIPAAAGVTGDQSPSSSSDGGDLLSLRSDLLSLRSDSFSLTSELTVSRRSEDDDTRSVAASSVMTALHWAAKQGCQEAVDMMLRSGADVNIRSGYTALHLASIHGHQDVVQTLINTHNAKTSLRDYHGKTAVHYWSGCTDVFNKPDCQSGGSFSRSRRTQRYGLPSLLLSRSRSQGQIHLDFGTPPPSASHDALDLHV
ncbi:ankyrin repeat domain-containing protein SOWAHA [Brachyistius frenatus]|uniref:ankyrin repeat domain-containing protein SOWAHA n=1 Tax=Brachyistius frenatus TaxID=100188 RepID=UPI0037E8C5F1